MINRIALALGMSVLAGWTPSQAATVWFCSIIDGGGKPQVVKYAVDQNNLVIDDQTRSDEHTLKLVEDRAKGLVAVAIGASETPPKQYDSIINKYLKTAGYEVRVLILDKRTGEMSDVRLSTIDKPVETKGSCKK